MKYPNFLLTCRFLRPLALEHTKWVRSSAARIATFRYTRINTTFPPGRAPKPTVAKLPTLSFQNFTHKSSRVIFSVFSAINHPTVLGASRKTAIRWKGNRRQSRKFLTLVYRWLILRNCIVSRWRCRSLRILQIIGLRLFHWC